MTAIEGTNNNDTLDGTNAGDVIDGGGGNDSIVGGGGDDSIAGDSGDDIISGGDGADTLIGGEGLDVLYDNMPTSPAADPVLDDDDDVLSGEYVYSTGGADTLNGNTMVVDRRASPVAVDFIDGAFSDGTRVGSGEIVFHGTALADTYRATSDNAGNTVYGYGGDDVIGAGDGHNLQFYGGAGNDTLSAEPPYYDDRVGGVAALLDGEDGNDMLIGSTGRDTIRGRDGDDYFDDAGMDEIEVYADFGGHSNTWEIELYTRTGDDVVFGGAGNDTLTSATGDDSLYGGDGDDILRRFDTPLELESASFLNARSYNIRGGSTVESIKRGLVSTPTLDGGNGDDTLSAENDAILLGGAGSDDLLLEAGGRAEGGDDDDILRNLSGTSMLNGGAGDDQIVGGSGRDGVSFSHMTSDIVLDLDQTVLNIDGTDTLTSIEDAEGGQGNDLIIAIAAGSALIGLEGNDTLRGHDGEDTLEGREGDDVLDGGAGDDTLVGGEGDDEIVGGEGRDRISFASMTSGVRLNLNSNIVTANGTDTLTGIEDAEGSWGDDHLVASSADTALYGLNNQDTLRGQAGNDTLVGGDGRDSLIGNRGNDFLDGGDENDHLLGNQGDDTIVGGNNWDTLSGGDGDDSLYGGTADDTLEGGAGNDTLDGGGDDDVIIGGEGRDRVSFASVNRRVDIDLSSNIVTANGTDTLTSIEDAEGGTVGDQLVARSTDTGLYGLAGNDTLRGKGGDDTLEGGAGRDSLLGSRGNDILDGGLDRDTMVGGEGDDTYLVHSADDVIVEADGEGIDTVESWIDINLAPDLERLNLKGTAGVGRGNGEDNTILGNANGNLLAGLRGDDYLAGRDGDDTLDGGPGVDNLRGGRGDDTYILGDLDDHVVEETNEGWDTVQTDLSGYVLGDNLEALRLTGDAGLQGTGNDGDNMLVGGAGDDMLYGMEGADTLEGGQGKDSLIGGRGGDLYQLDAGRDVVVLTHRNDSGLSNRARDEIRNFKPGADRIDVSGLDADVTTAGHQRFEFIGNADFTEAGQIRREPGQMISINLDDDTDAEMMIEMDVRVFAEDFIF